MKKIFCSMVMFAVLSTVLSCYEKHPVSGGEKLPKIIIAKDSRSFVSENGQPFVPFGVNYFRPGTGWAPQIWKTFDETAFRQDFSLMKDAGVNCVRVFLTYGSFMTEKGMVNQEALRKFDKLLDIADEYGIYIHPTGPDHWEGPGCLNDLENMMERFTDDGILEATIMFWKVFAARNKGRNAIFAYDLLNEPVIPWSSPSMKLKWNEWLKSRYQTAENFAEKRNIPLKDIQWGNEDAPEDFSNKELILDYQQFREGLADHWTKIQVEAIKSVDPDALVTVGLIQWSIPTILPNLQSYAAFNPYRLTHYLDFLEFHFYPLATGFYEYEQKGAKEKNLAYIESLAKEVAAIGQPVVVAEFGWYGGGKLKNSWQNMPEASEEQQAEWNTALIETTKGLAVGWLNWGFFDMPEALDISELLGLYTVERQPKAWGIAFKRLSEQLSGQVILPKKMGERPKMNWDMLISDPQAGPEFMEEYLKAFLINK